MSHWPDFTTDYKDVCFQHGNLCIIIMHSLGNELPEAFNSYS